MRPASSVICRCFTWETCRWWARVTAPTAELCGRRWHCREKKVSFSPGSERKPGGMFPSPERPPSVDRHPSPAICTGKIGPSGETVIRRRACALQAWPHRGCLRTVDSAQHLRQLSVDVSCSTKPTPRGSATPMKMGGRGPGGSEARIFFRGYPIPKTENSADLAHYFPENGGLSPHSQKMGGRAPVPPVAEPLPTPENSLIA